MWFIATIILVFSAFFAAYLTEAYTTSFQIATFAKSTAMILGLTGIVMLIVAIGWWGLTGIVGYWLLLSLFRVFWNQRLGRRF